MRTRIPHLPHLIRSATPTAELVPDRALLAEFESAKCGMAFELLVRRHGPTVWAVCRRHLANTHDAEDAFQATFLVLAKSAKRIAKHASVGSWLYGVAYRIALKARRAAARRKRVEAVVSHADEPATLSLPAFSDTTAVVHAELEKLPDRYRLPVLLCDLEGLSRKEASAQLGWGEGTLSGRLNRARKLLADRLTARGIAAAVLTTMGITTFPPSQAMTAAAVGVGLNVIGATTSAASETVAALAHGAMRDMTRSFILKTAGVVLAASVLLTGGLFGLRLDTAPEATAAPVPKVEMAKANDITPALLELLQQPAVQRELRISPEGRVSLIDGFDKLDEKLDETGVTVWQSVPGRDLPPQAAPDPREQRGGGSFAGAILQKDSKDRRELVATVLTKGQFTRLQQCEVQVLGVRALLLKRVADELGLSDEQKKAVTAAISGSTPPQVDFLPARLQNPAWADSVGPTPEVEQKRIIDDFTPGQQKKWKELNGEKVGFDTQRVANRCPNLFTSLFAATDGPQIDGGPVLPLPQTGVFHPGNPPVLPQPPITPPTADPPPPNLSGDER